MTAFAARFSSSIGLSPTTRRREPVHDPANDRSDRLDALLGRAMATLSTALLVVFLLALLAGEYLLVWSLLFAPWGYALPALLP